MEEDAARSVWAIQAIDTAPSAFDDLADNCHSHAATFNLIARLKRLKHLEGSIALFGRNTHAVVFVFEFIETRSLEYSEVDVPEILAVMLHGVGEEVC